MKTHLPILEWGTHKDRVTPPQNCSQNWSEACSPYPQNWSEGPSVKAGNPLCYRELRRARLIPSIHHPHFNFWTPMHVARDRGALRGRVEWRESLLKGSKQKAAPFHFGGLTR